MKCIWLALCSLNSKQEFKLWSSAIESDSPFLHSVIGRLRMSLCLPVNRSAHLCLTNIMTPCDTNPLTNCPSRPTYNPSIPSFLINFLMVLNILSSWFSLSFSFSLPDWYSTLTKINGYRGIVARALDNAPKKNVTTPGGWARCLSGTRILSRNEWIYNVNEGNNVKGIVGPKPENSPLIPSSLFIAKRVCKADRFSSSPDSLTCCRTLTVDIGRVMPLDVTPARTPIMSSSSGVRSVLAVSDALLDKPPTPAGDGAAW